MGFEVLEQTHNVTERLVLRLLVLHFAEAPFDDGRHKLSTPGAAVLGSARLLLARRQRVEGVARGGHLAGLDLPHGGVWLEGLATHAAAAEGGERGGGLNFGSPLESHRAGGLLFDLELDACEGPDGPTEVGALGAVSGDDVSEEHVDALLDIAAIAQVGDLLDGGLGGHNESNAVAAGPEAAREAKVLDDLGEVAMVVLEPGEQAAVFFGGALGHRGGGRCKGGAARLGGDQHQSIIDPDNDQAYKIKSARKRTLGGAGSHI